MAFTLLSLNQLQMRSIPIFIVFENYLDDQIPESDNFHQTFIHEITKIIKNLKNSNSVGWHNIPTNILKINAMTLAQYSRI